MILFYIYDEINKDKIAHMHVAVQNADFQSLRPHCMLCYYKLRLSN